MSKRYITNCKTGKLSLVEPDAEFLAQRATDKIASDAENIKREVKMERDGKIQAEMYRVAEQSLIDQHIIGAK